MSTTASASNAAALDILVVEDNDVEAQLTLHALTHLNPRPRTLWLSDSREVMDYLMCRRHEGRSHGLPSLVLADIHMPCLSGIELLAQIRAEPRLCHLPVIMLSANAISNELRECYQLGADGYVEKGIGYGRFTTQLAQAVTRCFNSALITRDP